MSKNIVAIIEEQTKIMLYNMRTAILTCDMDYILCGMPIWKHVYHTLHSCDQWFINPTDNFIEPEFHKPGLNSLDIPNAQALSKETLLEYLSKIEKKLITFFNELTDEKLVVQPDGCEFSNLKLMIGQMRHFNVHLGNINATTIITTHRWPRVAGLRDSLDGSLYEE